MVLPQPNLQRAAPYNAFHRLSHPGPAGRGGRTNESARAAGCCQVGTELWGDLQILGTLRRKPRTGGKAAAPWPGLPASARTWLGTRARRGPGGTGGGRRQRGGGAGGEGPRGVSRRRRVTLSPAPTEEPGGGRRRRLLQRCRWRRPAASQAVRTVPGRLELCLIQRLTVQ